MKKLLHILLIGMLFISCCTEEPRENDNHLIRGSEFRGKVDLDRVVDKTVKYVVIHFYENDKFIVGNADEGGMIYEEVESGFYELIGREITLYKIIDGEKHLIRRLYHSSTERTIAYAYGVEFYRQY